MKNQDLQKIYKTAKNVPSKSFEKSKVSKKESFEVELRMVGKLAHACDDVDSFIKAVNNNETPAVKLTAQEMEMLRGGGSWLSVLKKIPGVDLAVAAYELYEGYQQAQDEANGICRA